jgi:carbamoyltransferase
VNILGVSAYYHDSAAALVTDGQITAAAQEERFTRKKHDASFPLQAINYCLGEAGISLRDVDHLVFYDKPLVKFDRLLETYLSYAPSGFRSFLTSMPIWLKEKLYLKALLKKVFAELAQCDEKDLPALLFTEHHQAHAASAFFPSPFERAAVLCMDGVGEWATTTVWTGERHTMTPQWEIRFPHSMGLLYSAFTYYTGFKVNSGEYKLMGLAPYGQPKYVQTIIDNLVDIKDDGTFRLNMDYFNFTVGLTMTNKRFNALFGGPPRKSESTVTQREMDLARSIQVVTEEVILRVARTIHRELGEDNLCMAGGVALNCVANGRLLREGPFKKIWIQPAAGDAGGALGAALSIWHEYLGQPRAINGGDSMYGSYLGPRFVDTHVRAQLDSMNAVYQRLDDDSLLDLVAGILTDEKVVGWFQGRMEFGPRALGGRSIIGDPRSRKMQSLMNLKIKNRESFRPFAPSVLAEKVSEWFEMDGESPYMLLVAEVARSKQIEMSEAERELFGIEKLNVARSDIPAITHVDYSARIQTVHKETNPRYYTLLQNFERRTGCPILVNTSFNVRGEPIVCTPEDAYRCFMRTEMDYLVIENYLLAKQSQPAFKDDGNWRDEFELD